MNRFIVAWGLAGILSSSLALAEMECVSKDDKKPELKLFYEQVDPIIIKTYTSRKGAEQYYAVTRERGRKIEAKYFGSRKNQLEFLRLDADPKKGLLYNRKKDGDELQIVTGTKTRVLSCQLKI